MARIIEAFKQFFDSQGDPLVNGKLYFYVSGTTTPKDTFFDVAETADSKNTNPVILNGDGRAPNVFGTGSYRVILTDKDNVQILVRDPVGGLGGQEFGSDWNALITYQIGDIVRDDIYYYKGVSANNIGNRPTLDTEGSNWETWPPNTQDAEIYRDEALQFRNEAEVFRNEAAASAEDASISADEAAASAAAAAASADSAANSAAIALASANFLGEWSTLTGAATVPSSVIHNKKYWMLLTDLADITASEPSLENTDWAEIKTGGGSMPVNSFFNFYSTEDRLEFDDGTIWLKTGVVDTDVASYPDATTHQQMLLVPNGFVLDVSNEIASPRSIVYSTAADFNGQGAVPSWWVYGSGIVARYNAITGAYMSQFTPASHSNTAGMTFDGNNFYFPIASLMKVVNGLGEPVSEFAISTSSPTCVAFSGSELLVGKGATPNVLLSYLPDGTYTGGRTTSLSDNPIDLAAGDEGQLWRKAQGTARPWKLLNQDQSGNYIYSGLYFGNSTVLGMGYSKESGTYLWHNESQVGEFVELALFTVVGTQTAFVDPVTNYPLYVRIK